MKILVDATCLTGRMDGWGRYAFNLLKKFSQIDSRNQYTILVQRRKFKQGHPILKIQLRENFSIRKVGFRAAGPAREFKFLLNHLGENWDVFHCLSSYLPIFQRFPSIVTIHDLKFLKYPRLLGNNWWVKSNYIKHSLKISAKKARKVIAVSKSTKQDIADLLGISMNKVEVIYESANINPSVNSDDASRILKKYSIHKPYFLYLGVGSPHKNIKGLVQAFAKFKKNTDHLNTKLVLAGAVHKDQDLFLRKINDSEIAKDIIFTGFVPEKDLPILYSEALAFILVSFYEGFGLPILEAMKCGTPVITSNISSMPEVTADAALLVDPYNTEEIAKGMTTMANSDQMRKEYIEKGKQRACNFSWEKAAKETLEIYRKVC